VGGTIANISLSDNGLQSADTLECKEIFLGNDNRLKRDDFDTT